MAPMDLPPARPPPVEPYRDEEVERIRRWAEAEARRGIPRQQIEDALLVGTDEHRDLHGNYTETSNACFVVAAETMFTMDHRELAADQHEREGREDEAVRLNEENVRDCYMRPHSYDRLVEIYRRRGNEVEARRVLDLLHRNTGLREILTRVPAGQESP